MEDLGERFWFGMQTPVGAKPMFFTSEISETSKTTNPETSKTLQLDFGGVVGPPLCGLGPVTNYPH